MEVSITILIFAGVIALVGGAIWWGFVLEKKRRESLKFAADEMGLSYLPDGDPQLMEMASSFNVCNAGRSRKMYNLIEGETDEVLIAIFDYRYTTGGGKNSHTHNQTIVLLRSQQLLNPSFTMRPEGFFDRIGGALGLQDIDFETHPTFSESFVLKSPDEEATRLFFNPAMLEYFERKLGVCVEAIPGALVFYRTRARCKPEEFKSLFAEAYEVFGAMVDRGKA